MDDSAVLVNMFRVRFGECLTITSTDNQFGEKADDKKMNREITEQQERDGEYEVAVLSAQSSENIETAAQNRTYEEWNRQTREPLQRPMTEGDKHLDRDHIQ